MNDQRKEQKHQYDREWRALHKEHIVQYKQEYYRTHQKQAQAYYQVHRGRYIEQQAAYYRSHKGRVQREYKARLKIETFEAYGGAHCICCGEVHIEFLSIDHVDGGGAQHRKAIHGRNMYQWLKIRHYPLGFRVLCMNCNFALGKFGYCPHGVLPTQTGSEIHGNIQQSPLF